MRVFEFNDARALVKTYVEKRGLKSKLAGAIGVHTTSMSQMLSGAKPISLEHASEIADFFDFSQLESEYFLLLVQLDRAATTSLKKRISSQIERALARVNDLSESLVSDKKLSLKDQTCFYSDWKYSAIRVLSSISNFNSVDPIAAKLGINKSELKDKIDFLVRTGLCVYAKGLLQPGPTYTHLKSDSPLISKFHSNIRVKAMSHHASLNSEDLSYSALLSVDEKDIPKVRTILQEAIQKIQKIRENGEGESLQLLGIDWIKI